MEGKKTGYQTDERNELCLFFFFNWLFPLVSYLLVTLGLVKNRCLSNLVK